MEITLKLDLQEVNVVLAVLGQLPTSSNIWPLAAKVRAQAQAQIPEQQGTADEQGSATD